MTEKVAFVPHSVFSAPHAKRYMKTYKCQGKTYQSPWAAERYPRRLFPSGNFYATRLMIDRVLSARQNKFRLIFFEKKRFDWMPVFFL